jgi:RNA polymerase sigma-54 factor
MKQSLQLRTSQHLALTPQLQQSIRLLQLSTLELHQEIEQILSDNPLLERLDDPLDHSVRLLADGAINSTPAQAEAPAPNAEEGAAAPDTGEAGEGGEVERGESDSSDWGELSRGSGADGDDDGRPQLGAVGVTLREHLSEQIRVTGVTARDRALAELVIDAIDDNGYLEEQLDEIHARLPAELEVEMDELRCALALVQSLDPTGVGARSASECLALQIRAMPGVPLVTRRRALKIVEFTRRRGVRVERLGLRGAGRYCPQDEGRLERHAEQRSDAAPAREQRLRQPAEAGKRRRPDECTVAGSEVAD